MLKKVTAILCALLLLLCSVPVYADIASRKESTQKTIAIVYDNSGSMFSDGNKAWCQAQYAIEVFAAMMNDGDKLMVYPMWSINLENSNEVYSYQDNKPLVITDNSQKGSIRTIQSDLREGSTTPIESIDVAYNGLMEQSGERWMIVLTDGLNFYQNGEELSVSKTKKTLEERFTQYNENVNILYLGIGNNISAPEITPIRFYAARTTVSENVPNVLTELCNLIFGRDVLPEKYVSGNSVSFDVPFSKLYVFIQGENIHDIRLSSGGKELSATQNFSPSYGTRGCVRADVSKKDFGIDQTLQGCMLVYENLESGTYDYSYAGTKSDIAFYYEVDANLAVSLFDEAGNPITSADSVRPGSYSLVYALVDKQGRPLSSDLLGNVAYKLAYSFDGKTEQESGDTPGEIPLELENGTPFALQFAEVEFLNGYRIRKEGDELGFLATPFVASKENAKNLSLTLSGGIETIDGDQFDDFPAYQLDISYDGHPITQEELQNITISQEISGSFLDCAVTETDTGFVLVPTTKEEGTVVPAGTYKLLVSATYSSEIEEAATAFAEVAFTVNELSDILTIELDDPTVVYSTMTKDMPKTKAHILLNGDPLSEEQFQALSFRASADGLELKVNPLPAERSYEVEIDTDKKIEKGHYTLVFQASNIQGRAKTDLAAEERLNIKIQLFPLWLEYLLIALGLLLLALLIFLYLWTPVLPRAIKLKNVRVTIDGDEFKTLKATVSYPNKGKKRIIRISGTGILGNVYWNATLTPTKDSYRYLSSSKRKAMVINGTVTAASSVESITIGGGEQFVRDDDRKLKRVSPSTKDFRFPKGSISFFGTKDINGTSSEFSISADIQFADKK